MYSRGSVKEEDAAGPPCTTSGSEHATPCVQWLEDKVPYVEETSLSASARAMIAPWPERSHGS